MLYKKTHDHNKTRILNSLIPILYAVLWILLTIFRINNNSFWGDEAWTIYFSKMKVFDFVKATSLDVHPPLYYLIVWIFTKILGFKAYVYRLVSFWAYIIMLIISVSYINKHLGALYSIFFTTLQSILIKPMIQNTEARMYSWALLFVFLSYIYFKKIIDSNTNHSYVLYGIFVTLSAYTHYYALVAVAILCAFLLAYSLFHKEYIIKTLLTGFGVIALYFPWLIVLFKTFRRTKNDYWITNIPDLASCIRYPFKSSTMLEFTCIILLLVIILYLFLAFFNNKHFNVLIQKEADSKELWWIVSGIATIIGTSIVGIGISYIFRPMFQIKYIYPTIAIAWLVLLICLSHIKYGQYVTVILCLLFIITCFNGYKDRYYIEKARDEHVNETLSQIYNIVEKNDIILAENDSSSCKLLYYYFPGIENEEIEDISMFNFESNNSSNIWVITQQYYDSDTLNTYMVNSGKTIDLFIDSGMIGINTVNIYRIH